MERRRSVRVLIPLDLAADPPALLRHQRRWEGELERRIGGPVVAGTVSSTWHTTTLLRWEDEHTAPPVVWDWCFDEPLPPHSAHVLLIMSAVVRYPLHSHRPRRG